MEAVKKVRSSSSDSRNTDKKYLTVKDLKTGKKHKVVRNPNTGTYSFYVVGNNKK
jgi:hypothetical protein